MGGMLLKNPMVDKTDLSTVTSIHMTGAPTGSALQQLIIDKLPKSTHVGNCEYFMGLPLSPRRCLNQSVPEIRNRPPYLRRVGLPSEGSVCLPHDIVGIQTPL